MVKLLTIILISTMLHSGLLPDAKSVLPEQMNSIALKALISKAPAELNPEMAVTVGGMYQFGMEELSLKKNLKKAKLYYKSGADRNVTIGNLLLANMALEEKDIDTYASQMEIIIKADDEKLSIPAGLQLSSFWTAMDNYEKSTRVLQYLAEVYNEPRAQFLLGWAIVTKEYVPDGLTEKDGQFYLYQACNNPSKTEEIQKQCDLYSK